MWVGILQTYVTMRHKQSTTNPTYLQDMGTDGVMSHKVLQLLHFLRTHDSNAKLVCRNKVLQGEN